MNKVILICIVIVTAIFIVFNVFVNVRIFQIHKDLDDIYDRLRDVSYEINEMIDQVNNRDTILYPYT